MINYILGIHLGPNCGCALMRNGEIIYVGQEERFKRLKNFTGFPHESLHYGMEKFRIQGKDIASVGIATIIADPLLRKANHTRLMSLRDWHDYYGSRYWDRVFQGLDTSDFDKWLRDDPKFNTHQSEFDYSFITDELLGDKKRRIEVYPNHIRSHLGKHFGISSQKISFLDHHTCHAHYSYFGSHFRGKPCANVVLDGIGDGRNQTVFTSANDNLELVAESKENDIGRVYKMATLLLGMKPEEHEYKVMGLAPYCKGKFLEEAYAPLEQLSKIEDMKILNHRRPKDLYSYLKHAWMDKRFDHISGAVQRFAEKIAVELFKSIYEVSGLRRFTVSGGISMNIKMNKILSELDFVDEFFVCGSGSDESLGIGACYLINSKNKNNKPMEHMSLGYDIQDDLNQPQCMSLFLDYKIEENVEDKQVARLLADGKVVARVEGQAEFGARALGNRSILANPSDVNVVQFINEAIKNRDFWMPFALSVLEDQQDYSVYNPKGLKSPFMSIGFDSSTKNYDSFKAGTHPYDRSVRPQFVNKMHSPRYYNLISEFNNLTGIPALLNTSFNLHGEPIVNNVYDALHTFSKSKLEYLYIGTKLVTKP